MRLTKSNAPVMVLASIFLTVTFLTAQQKNPLTNADVIKMVKAGQAETGGAGSQGRDHDRSRRG